MDFIAIGGEGGGMLNEESRIVSGATILEAAGPRLPRGRSRLVLGVSLAAMVAAAVAVAPRASHALYECGLAAPGDTVICTSLGNDYPFGITYDVDDLTIVLDEDVNVFSGANSGVWSAANGFLTVRTDETAEIRTTGPDARGIFVSSFDDSVYVDNSATISTSGDFAPAIFTTAPYGSTEIYNYGALTTSGIYSHGILALSLYGPITITNEGDITTLGDYARGIFVFTEDGPITITNEGDITTHGDHAHGIFAWTFDGPITITNEEDITTYGVNAKGIWAESDYGNITVTNSGDITTEGDGADGIFTFAWNGSTTIHNSGIIRTSGDPYPIGGRPNPALGIYAGSNAGSIDITNIGEVHTEGAAAAGIFANSVSGDVTIYNSGIVTTTGGTFVYGITYIAAGIAGQTTTGMIDITNVGEVHTEGAAAVGIFGNSVSGDVTINNSGVVTTAGGTFVYNGIIYSAPGIAARTTGAIVITNSGTVQTLGQDADGLWARNGSSVTITNSGTGTITTGGDDAHGIDALTASGPITINNQGWIATMGAGSHGILAVRDGGAEPILNDIAITNSGDITTAGFGASGIVVSNDLGNFNVTVSGTVTTSGNSAPAIDAFTDAGSGSVNTLAGVISTSGNNSAGVWAYANGSLDVAVGTVTTTGDNSPGVDAYATGDVTVTALDVTTLGDYSTGIIAGSELGDVDVTVTDVTTLGAHAPGVYAFTGSGDVAVTVLGDVVASGPGSSGVIVDTPDGLQSVFVDAGASITSGPDGSTPAAVVFEGTGMAWLVNHGLIQAANDRVVSSVSSSSTTIDNFGTMIGNVILGDGPDTFNNHGLFRARGDSFFGGGFDRFINRGTVRVIDGPVTFHGLEVFDNSDGIIDMVDGVPNDSLTLPGEYVGGGLLAVDALLGPGGGSDQLIIQGIVSGDPTAVAVNFIGIGPTSEGISVVTLENGEPAGQFFLADGPIDAGLFRVDLLGVPGGFFLVTVPDETSGSSTSTMEVVRTFTREIGDFDRMSEILDGEAEEALLEDDEVPAVAQVQPGSWAKIVGSSVTQDTRTSFTLADTPMRHTDRFDLGLVGIIGGLDIAQSGVHEGTRYAWLVGVLGGYVWADVDFATATGTQDIEAAVFGGYGGLAYGGFRMHVLGKVDSGNVRFNEPDLAPGIAARGRSDFMTVSLETNVGYKFSLPNSMYVQPIASLYYSHTTLEAVTLGGTTVEFEDLDSLRARAGLRLGANIVHGNYVLDPWVQASIWHELLDSDSKVTLASGGTSLDLIGAGVETYGEVGTGINVVRIGPGLSGQVRFDAKFGDLDLLALSGQVGLEYRFPVQ